MNTTYTIHLANYTLNTTDTETAETYARKGIKVTAVSHE